jgi:hypothetical protein
MWGDCRPIDERGAPTDERGALCSRRRRVVVVGGSGLALPVDSGCGDGQH